jgi:alkyl hydroperoxide reductase subunit AhpC
MGAKAFIVFVKDRYELVTAVGLAPDFTPVCTTEFGYMAGLKPYLSVVRQPK